MRRVYCKRRGRNALPEFGLKLWAVGLYRGSFRFQTIPPKIWQLNSVRHAKDADGLQDLAHNSWPRKRDANFRLQGKLFACGRTKRMPAILRPSQPLLCGSRIPFALRAISRAGARD